MELDLGVWLGQYLWPLSRISAFVLAMPILGSRIVPMRIRLLFCLLLTAVAAPMLQNLPRCNPLSMECWVIVVQQTLIGLTLGFMMQILFQVANITGQLVATQSGLGFSSMMDPNTGVSVASISQFYTMLVTLLFLSMDGHLVLIDYLVRSFQVLPITRSWDIPFNQHVLLASGTWMFAASLLAALPAMAALLVVNLALGVMTRAAPQLNIFSVGFPITLMLGLLLIWLSLDSFAEQFRGLSDQAFAMLQEVVRT
ncbi:MAG: flagellar biosynthetic protein FliR [Pseudomonadales bacterium]|nr:flagellar biosynthetic protein FliR [Pseudomonadales bacterium]